MTELPPRKKPPPRRRRARPSGLVVRKRRPVPPPQAGAPPDAKTQQRGQNQIVSPKSVARRTLLALVAIMSFLACVAVAAVSVVADRAHDWERQIAAEVTVQVKPQEGVDLDAAVTRAVEIATQMPGVRGARALSADESAALLEPWLGSNFDASELPIPRLIAIQTSDGLDLAALSKRLATDVPGSSVDDHGRWMGRLASMANVMTVAGSIILGLVFLATALCVVFATRGAMAGNRDVIEVLHFVGAEDSYVARQFQRHFLILGLKGAGIGCAIAVVLFAAAGLFAGFQGSSPEEAQLRSLVGGVVVGPIAYIGALVTVVILALIIAATAGLTVRRTLTELD